MKINKKFDKYIIKKDKKELVISPNIVGTKDEAELSQVLFDSGFYFQPTFINPAVLRWYK